MTEDEFSAAIKVFLREMSVICLSQTTESIRRVPGLREECEEALAALRAPNADEHTLLSNGFGIFDEFVSGTWDKLAPQLYHTYTVDRRGR